MALKLCLREGLWSARHVPETRPASIQLYVLPPPILNFMSTDSQRLADKW